VASVSERIPPHNNEAEESILGAMLLSADALERARSLLAATDFYRPAHRTIFEAIGALHDAGEPADPVTLGARLRDAGQLADVGGAPFLLTLIETVPTTANVGHYARIVKQASTLRMLIDTGTRITQLGYQTPQDTQRAVGLAESWVGQVASSMNGLRTKKEERSDPPPAVDRAMFRGILGEIVAKADPTTEADPVGVYASLLAGAGALIGPGPHVQVGNTSHPLLIWPLLFGRTGSGRKGEGTETGELFLHSSSEGYWEIRVSGLSSGEGLIERVRDPIDVDDEGGTEDKRLLVVEPEFSSVMARAKREGSTLAGVLREAWAGKPLGVLNRRALKASSSHVAIVGHVTPREFRLRLADADMAGGTFNRFLPVWVERSKRLPIPDGIDDLVKVSLGKRLGDAILEARKVSRVNFDREATLLWSEELYDELTAADDEDQAWTEFTRRAAPYCLRIAATSAALDGRRLISIEDLDAAGALVRYSIASAKYVLDQQSRDPQMDRIRRSIDGAGADGLSRTEISKLFSGNLPAIKLDALLSELLGDDDYERFEVKTGGRPAERYRRRSTKKEERTP
jgi:hypothetical protein